MPPDGPSQPADKPVEEGGVVGVISATGAIIVVCLGLVFVFVMTLVSLGTVPSDQKSTVVTAAFTVVGTVVGTYFGVRAGAAGKERVEAARDFETMKVRSSRQPLTPRRRGPPSTARSSA